MIAATLRTQAASGLRRVDLGRDLAAIADLIELCFQSSMDAGGRATVNEMRSLSRMGPLLGLMALGDDMLKGIGQGFVWEEAGRVMGNVTLFPARVPPELGPVTVVANVAVHPDLQRRGIGRQLMETSLEALRASGTRCAILQVDHDNDVARRLYERLGFKPERTWHQWRRGPSQSVPSRGATAPRLTLRPANRWREEYALAERVFPQARGGLGWQRPLHPREFTRSPWQAVLEGLGGTTVERWIVLDVDRIVGALWARTSLTAGQTQLTLIVHPDWQGRLEDTLINYAIRRLAADYRPLAVEHPADDLAATLALERYGFVKRRTLQHMRLDF